MISRNAKSMVSMQIFPAVERAGGCLGDAINRIVDIKKIILSGMLKTNVPQDDLTYLDQIMGSLMKFRDEISGALKTS